MTFNQLFLLVGFQMRVGEFFCIPSFLFLPLSASCILHACFGLAFRRPFLFLFINFSVRLPIKKIFINVEIVLAYFMLKAPHKLIFVLVILCHLKGQ